MPSPEYTLPPEVAAALSTNRPELIDSILPEIKEGYIISFTEQVALLELVKQMITERQAHIEQMQELRDIMREVSQNMQGFVNKLNNHLG